MALKDQGHWGLSEPPAAGRETGPSPSEPLEGTALLTSGSQAAPTALDCETAHLCHLKHLVHGLCISRQRERGQASLFPLTAGISSRSALRSAYSCTIENGDEAKAKIPLCSE